MQESRCKLKMFRIRLVYTVLGYSFERCDILENHDKRKMNTSKNNLNDNIIKHLSLEMTSKIFNINFSNF